LGKGEKGEFICLNCEIHHLAEAMPFDKIRVKMYLRKIFDKGLDLYFDFFKLKNNLESDRLAYATHKVIFANLVDHKFVPKELPKNILTVIKKHVSVAKKS
jgi:acyl-CoA thioesterase FadM